MIAPNRENVWLEVRYGSPEKGGVLLSRLWNRDLLRTAKRKILEDLSDKALIEQVKDELQGIIAKADYKKNKEILSKLIPDN